MGQSTSSWNRWIISIHWITAFTVVGLFVLGLWMVELNYYSSWYKVAPMWHKSIGLLLALLTLARLLVRFRTVRPVQYGKSWEMAVSSVVHITLYLVLVVILTSGYLISTADGRSIMVFNWLAIPSSGEWFERQEDVAGDIHFWAAIALVTIAFLHSAAALKHHFIDKDATLKQMLKWRRSTR